MATNDELANIVIDTGYRVFKPCCFKLFKNDKGQIGYEQTDYQILSNLSPKQICAAGILEDRGVL
jgi:hypothetical protein